MGRKSKFDKATKVKACKDYINGIGTYESIAKSLDVNRITIAKWHRKFVIHGEDVFEISHTNNSLSKAFKLTVINDYISGRTSMNEAAAKYNISSGMISNWLKKYYNGIELKDYDPKGDVYTMKSRKTTFEERLEIVRWVIANDMSYKNAANKFANKYANIYKWTKAYMTDGVDALKDRKRGPKHKTFVDESSLSEIDKLKLELERERTLRKRREFELEVLKKKEEFENQSRYRK